MTSMEAKVQDWFSTLILGLGHIYPSARIESSMIAVWWVHMQGIEQKYIVDGLESAVKASPMFLPSAEQVRAAAIAARIRAAKQRESEERKQGLIGDSGRPGHPYIDPSNPCYDFAMKWQAESKAMGIGPNDRVPPDVAKRRIAELLPVIERIGAA